MQVLDEEFRRHVVLQTMVAHSRSADSDSRFFRGFWAVLWSDIRLLCSFAAKFIQFACTVTSLKSICNSFRHLLHNHVHIRQ